MGSRILADGVCKTYRRGDREVCALDSVALRVEPGESVAVMGPSGSGKSTLLNVLGLLAPPDAGRVVLDGIDTSVLSAAERLRTRRAKVGFVFQSFHLLPYLTAEENIRVALGLRAAGGGGAPVSARALLERFGLEGRADHVPDELSVGEKQRVALARAIAGNPSVILADEPTGNLDGAAAAIVCEHLGQFSRDGAAVIVVTHDERLAAMADRRLWIEAGRMLPTEDGKP